MRVAMAGSAVGPVSEGLYCDGVGEGDSLVCNLCLELTSQITQIRPFAISWEANQTRKRLETCIYQK